ncbi:CAF17-like 4Fe-4S cluster assembly/insertion protein YgfZ [Hyphococcus sp.]|uniref:CAF17-like 4Fe-4S cluster assembly/insertion protein YgfZ n=1 Tax=Hyphococcus sp. TaxID=2038636 RepID=UPI0035C6EEBB
MTEPRLLPDRAVIRLSGEDRFSFLQGIVTSDLTQLNAAPALFAALLTPQGKILFDFFIVKEDDALLIDCRKEAAEALMKRLTLYKLRAKVGLEIAEDKQVIVSDSEIAGGFADPRHDKLGWRAIISDGGYSTDTEYNARRIALGVAEFGEDFSSEEMFLTDVNYDVLNGVNYKKGCFIGQEVSSRMKRKGDARRRSILATFDGPAPDKGAPVTAGGSTLGEIMNSVDGRALALIRMDRWEKAQSDSAAVECGGKSLHLQIPDYLKTE